MIRESICGSFPPRGWAGEAYGVGFGKTKVGWKNKVKKGIETRNEEQLKESIAYSSSHVHFFWQHETMVSHVKDQVYDLWDMIGNDTN